MSPRARSTWTSFLRPPFLVCTLVLAAAASMTGPVARWASVALAKEPIPLRKALADMRRSGFGPFEFEHATRLRASIIDSLGTDKYLSWIFRDTRRKKGSPLRFAHVTVTYYTGSNNLVPHTPDVCLPGSGYQLLEAENTTVDLPSLAPGDTELPIRVLTFVKSQVFDRDKLTVIYTFHCNGRFALSRTEVRGLLSDPFSKHAYFCKVEVNFSATKKGRGSAKRDKSVLAAQELLGYLLPALLQEHLPDWEAAEGVESAGANV